MSFDPEKVKEREKRVNEALLLLTALYIDLVLSLSEYTEITEYLIVSSWEDTVSQLNSELVSQGWEPVDPESLKPILNRALSDLKDEMGELFDDPTGSQNRMSQTIWFTNWETYSKGTTEGIKKSGVDTVTWNTQNDERVCSVCGPRHLQTYSVGTEPELPAHVSCRCFWTVPEGRTDAADAQRQILDNMHTDYMKKLHAIHG